ncbi:protein translocase subunit SecD [Candidatus Dependentiae bacterium]
MRKLFFSWMTFWIVVSGLIVWRLWPLRDNLKFGIDLVGGTFLTLQVQTDKAVESQLKSIVQVLPERLKKANIKLPAKKDVKNEKAVLTFDDVNACNKAFTYLKDNYTNLVASIKDKVITFHFKKGRVNKIKNEAVETNTEIFRNRLNKLSVEEVNISRKGENQIIIELPDVADPQMARAMIGKPAVLEFKLVEKTGKTEADILYEYDGVMPDGKEIIPSKERSDGKPESYCLVSKYADVTGNMLRNARATIGGKLGVRPIVTFEFNSEGGDRFYDLTSKNPGRQLAIILDGQVISAPGINEPIRASGYIEGGDFTSEATKELAMLLKSGSLVAPVTIEEDRQIGATLGAESIRKGLFSCLVGLALLFLFSVAYYKFSGFLAFLALLFNLVLVLFGLHSIKATLTLPGIAGMVLTIGMAVDASILIFERIKDALAAGVSVKKAVNSGFAKAMIVIMDANITTFIVGIVLYQFGTGPLRGFAVTMMLGIIATLITGLIFLRSMFNFTLSAFKVKKLSI